MNIFRWKSFFKKQLEAVVQSEKQHASEIVFIKFFALTRHHSFLESWEAFLSKIRSTLLTFEFFWLAIDSFYCLKMKEQLTSATEIKNHHCWKWLWFHPISFFNRWRSFLCFRFSIIWILIKQCSFSKAQRKQESLGSFINENNLNPSFLLNQTKLIVKYSREVGKILKNQQSKVVSSWC